MTEAHDVFPKLMKAPIQCALWKQPELVKGKLDEWFERLEILVDEESPIGNVYRMLLRCRECNQFYFMEIYTRKGGSYHTFIPVETREIAEQLSPCSIYDLFSVFPRLQNDRMMDGSRNLRWIIGDSVPPGC